MGHTKDFPSKLVPRATALRGCMVKTVCVRAAQCSNLTGHIGRRRRTSELAVDYADATTFPRQPQHEVYKILPSLGTARMGAVKSRSAENVMPGIDVLHRLLALQLRRAVNIQRTRFVTFDVGFALF